MLSTMDHQITEFARRLEAMARIALQLRAEALAPEESEQDVELTMNARVDKTF